MATMTKFTNNVLRAKAVKTMSPKFGGKKPGNTGIGQSAKGSKGSMGGAQGTPFGGSKPAVQNIKGA